MEMQRRRLGANMVVPGPMSENTLQVWRSLPREIRHDPSMASFQMENERIHGIAMFADKESTLIEESHIEEDAEYITMKKLYHNVKSNEISASAAGNTAQLETCNDTTAHHREDLSNNDKARNRLYKRMGLLLFWMFGVLVLMSTVEKHLVQKTIVVSTNQTKLYMLPSNPKGNFNIKLRAAFDKVYSKEMEKILTVQPQIMYFLEKTQLIKKENVLTEWNLAIVAENMFDTAPIVSRNITYELPKDILSSFEHNNAVMCLSIETNANESFALEITYNSLIIDVKIGTILAACILAAFYSILVLEIFHRTFAAITCSILSVTVLACFNDRPNMQEIVQWMDMELLTLIFFMMIIVVILTETGVFDYLSVVAFEISHGKVWPMIYCVCIITCLVSSFLDNMTTVLLMAPVAIRLCEVMSLDPVPVILGTIVHANIGGALTPVGDPISIIISTNQYFVNNGVTFLKFISYTIPGVILVVLQSLGYMRVIFRDDKSLHLNESKDIKELRREILLWRRASHSISLFAKDAHLVRETMFKKIKVLKHQLSEKLHELETTEDIYVHTLEELKLKYPIKDKMLLLKTCAALVFIITSFIIQSIPKLRTLPLGWAALLGVLLLLIILDRDDFEQIMHRIEWTTLLFFAATFVMMECVERLGLFAWIGEITENIIIQMNKDYRLFIAIMLILWISALTSAIVDSIPVSLMMTKVVVSLASKESLGLPLQPLVWALVFGVGLGGNGTLYGASSNVIAVGIAEQHGYKISFYRYFKIVFPMMLMQLLVTSAYLYVVHILLEWHD